MKILNTWLSVQLLFSQLFCMFFVGHSQDRRVIRELEYPGWCTNIDKRLINLDDLTRPGIPKDGIPVIDRPKFVTIGEAREWLSDNEPVIVLEMGNISRAYPLQILLWHELALDEINGVPIAITFCAMCHSAIVFERKVDGHTLTLSISGFIRNADMILYDRETESWWQQLTGEAVVGDMVGKRLKQLPAQIVSFAQFASAYPQGEVLSRNTGYTRDYGRNPHAGYDDVNGRPIMFRGKADTRLRPMEKLIGVVIGDKAKAYPYAISHARRVIYDRIGSQEVVVFHADGAASALDAGDMKKSREVGSTGVFDPQVDSRRLQFRYEAGQFIDAETGSHWDILGRAVSGKLRGKNLRKIAYGDYFAFAWFAFKPKSELFGS